MSTSVERASLQAALNEAMDLERDLRVMSKRLTRMTDYLLIASAVEEVGTHDSTRGPTGDAD